MKARSLGILCMVGGALACGRADAQEDDAKPKCTAARRGYRPAQEAVALRLQVAQERQDLEALKQEVAARKSDVDDATAAHNAAVQALTKEKAQGTTPTDSDLSAVSEAATKLAAAIIEWNKANNEERCLANDLDELRASYLRSTTYSYAPTMIGSVSGGAGGASSAGGGVAFSLRDTLFTEYQFGLTLHSLQEAGGPANAPPSVAAEENHPGRSLTFGIPLRMYFGSPPVSLLLGTSPQLVFRPTGTVLAMTGKVGVRLLGAPGWSVSSLVDVKIFAEPWVFFDGTSPSVLFGIEVGAGVGWANTDETSLKWTMAQPP
jgi:hypothetical protein